MPLQTLSLKHVRTRCIAMTTTCALFACLASTFLAAFNYNDGNPKTRATDKFDELGGKGSWHSVPVELG